MDMAASRNSEVSTCVFPEGQPPVIPADDEEPFTFMLQGMSETSQVVMSGWTNNIPMKFFNLKSDLNIKTVNSQDKRTEWPLNYKPDLIKEARPLKYYAERASLTNVRITDSINVLVLAKRSVHTIVKEGKLLMFGNLIIADESGFCTLTVVNCSVWTLYNQINVGDQLLICDGSYKQPYIPSSPYKPCFNEVDLLPVEIKVTHFQCRRVFHLTGFDNDNFASNLHHKFTSGRKLMHPSQMNRTKNDATKPPTTNDEQFLDIIGVVSYIGRLERIWNFQGTAEILDGSQKPFQTYTAFRWLELIDRDSCESLPITLYMNINIWNLQSSLTPGSVVIITNVLKPKPVENYGHKKLNSSIFTQIYINERIKDYVEKFPKASSNSILELFGSGRMREILEGNVSWSAGGLYSQPFASETEFCRIFNEKLNAEVKPILRKPKELFVKKETQRIYFRGEIIKFRIFNGRKTEPLWASENETAEMLDYKRYSCRLPYNPDGNWYAFTRNFPKPDFSSLKKDPNKRTQFNEFISSSYQKFCGSLTMPPAPDSSLKDLPMADGPPYYWLMIVDVEMLHAYTCIWKPSQNLRMDQMELKLENCKNRPVIGIIDIHCINDKEIDVLKYEVFLQDFTTNVLPPIPSINDNVE